MDKSRSRMTVLGLRRDLEGDHGLPESTDIPTTDTSPDRSQEDEAPFHTLHRSVKLHFVIRHTLFSTFSTSSEFNVNSCRGFYLDMNSEAVVIEGKLPRIHAESSRQPDRRGLGRG